MAHRPIRPLSILIACVLVASTAGLRSAGERIGAGPVSWANDLSPIAASDWNYDRAAHPIERAGFGATPAEIERLAALSLDRAVQRQVHYEPTANSLVK